MLNAALVEDALVLDVKLTYYLVAVAVTSVGQSLGRVRNRLFTGCKSGYSLVVPAGPATAGLDRRVATGGHRASVGVEAHGRQRSVAGPFRLGRQCRAGDLRPHVTVDRPGGLNLEQLGRSGFPAARSLSDPSLFLDGYAALVAQRAGDEGRDSLRLLVALRVLATLEA